MVQFVQYVMLQLGMRDGAQVDVHVVGVVVPFFVGVVVPFAAPFATRPGRKKQRDGVHLS